MDCAQWPVVPDMKCELCDTNVIQWKCLVCNELICDCCKRLHLKSKASKSHKVVSIDGNEKTTIWWRIQKVEHDRV